MEKSLLYTSAREDPISSKVSKSQNFTVLSAEPEKNIVCYKFTSNEGRDISWKWEKRRSQQGNLTRNPRVSHSDIWGMSNTRNNEVDKKIRSLRIQYSEATKFGVGSSDHIAMLRSMQRCTACYFPSFHYHPSTLRRVY